MLYQKRKHLIDAKIHDNSLNFAWDDWEREKTYLPIDKSFEKRMQTLTRRANLAFAIGCLEWIVYRFKGLFKEEAPDQYLEAAWASVVDYRYVLPWELNYEYWSGPILGSLSLGITIVIDTCMKVYQVYDVDREMNADPSTEAAELESLTRRLLNDIRPFEKWRDIVVQRLEKVYKRDPSDFLGPLVPPDVVDIDQKFSLDSVEIRIDKYLQSLDVKSNPYLRAPEDIYEEEGFEGVPYTLSRS
ncbi:MAG: hypothetical protein MJB14_18525 [Spirochaetes bacterium]|nr:hypothetical protein [Spirochaetota bacterium]